MKRSILCFTVILSALFALMSCERDSSSALSEDQLDMQSEQIIMNSMADDENEYMIDWGIDDGDEANMFNGFSTQPEMQSLPKSFASMDDFVRYGRKVFDRFPRRVVIRRIAKDTLLLNVTRELRGRFITIKIPQDTISSDSVVIYRKPLRHLVTRKAIFVKRSDDQVALRDPRRRWRLFRLSLAQGESIPAPTVSLKKVSVVSSAGDSLLFTDPLHTFLDIPAGLPTFQPGDIVTVTAYVENTSGNLVPNPQTGATETVLLHHGINRQHHSRREMQFVGIDPVTGYSVYQGKWTINEAVNHAHHAVIDVIDNGTIYEEDNAVYPYNSATWGCPYRVVLTD